jgi:hypothetical protein
MPCTKTAFLLETDKRGRYSSRLVHACIKAIDRATEAAKPVNDASSEQIQEAPATISMPLASKV